MITLTFKKLIAKEIAKALMKKQVMDQDDIEQEIIKQLNKIKEL